MEEDVDAYISRFPEATQTKLEEMRKIIQQAIPEATECISYKMPAYKIKKRVVVYFGGAKKHIGFYPTGKGVAAFQDKIQSYKHSKGAIQFPLDKELPVKLIKDICLFRLNQCK